MSTARSSTFTHLEAFANAKQRFKSALLDRCNQYQTGRRKDPVQRLYERYKTIFGKAEYVSKHGYEKTINFLEDINKPEITKTEDLIKVTKKYTTGTRFPLILRTTVLEICGFNDVDVDLVQRQVIEELQNHHDHHSSPALANLQLQRSRITAINKIYNKIIDSKDFGEEYLASLRSEIALKISNNAPTPLSLR